MAVLTSESRLREARDAYLDENGFSTDAYTDKWVHFQYGPIYLVFPSTKSRRRAIKFHDLHHVLTGYRATPIGEGEIGAWEVATGCRRLWAGWVLNLFAMGMAFPFAPGRVFRAFVRGRHCTNLYGSEIYEPYLERTLDDVRRELGLDREPPAPTAGDRLAFLFWLGVSAVQYAVVGAIVVVPVALLLWYVL